MLNRLKKLFFDEDIEEFELDEEIDKEVVKESVLVQNNPKPEIQKEVTPVKTETKPKMTIDIKADIPETKKKEEEKKAVKTRLIPKREEYEMPPVISPYFGVKEEEKNTESVQKKKAPIKKAPVAKKKEPFNTVISPFYGEQERNAYHPTLTPDTHEETEVKVDKIDSFYKENADLIDDGDDLENVSLDEIISNTNNESDDLIQFSLFGDGKRISEEDFQNEEINDDDNLPF